MMFENDFSDFVGYWDCDVIKTQPTNLLKVKSSPFLHANHEIDDTAKLYLNYNPYNLNFIHALITSKIP